MMTIEEIEDLLRKEIEWAIRFGPGFNPDYGAHFSDSKWSPRGCGTCAIGALVCHQQPEPPYVLVNYPEVTAAATIFGRSYDWTIDLYFAVGSSYGDPDGEIAPLGARLREFGRQVYKDMKALR